MNKTVEVFIHNGWFELVARWILGSAFIYASYHKIMEPAQFAKVIYGYYLFPPLTINFIAIILPFIELFCGLALVLGIYPRSAALVINFLLIAFILALSLNLVRGQEFDCGCFSFDESGYTLTIWETLIRDSGFFGLGLLVIFFSRHRKWCILQSGSILMNIHRSGRV